MQCIAMHANNNTNNSRKENYNHSNFLFYNNNYNKKRAGVALFVVSARPASWKENKKYFPPVVHSRATRGSFAPIGERDFSFSCNLSRFPLYCYVVCKTVCFSTVCHTFLPSEERFL